MPVVFINIPALNPFSVNNIAKGKNITFFNLETNMFTWYIYDKFVLLATFTPYVLVGRIQVLVSDKYFCCPPEGKKALIFDTNLKWMFSFWMQ